ncbi:MAG: HAD-IIA family hydrolase, partial [Actinomycetota bacterium]
MRPNGWVLDLDGVVRLGDRRITGSPEAIARLRAEGATVVFATNNSNDTVARVVDQLGRMGVPASPESIVTSATAAAGLVEPGERVLACGGPGVTEAIQRREAVPVDGRDPAPVDAVMVGFHPDFDYERMTVALRAVLDGARLIATNDDRTYPTEDGLAPGAGAILASVVAASGAEPVIAGKPNQPMADAIEAAFDGTGTSPQLVVGDRLDTDGAVAEQLGCPFALVLSGVATASDLVDDGPELVGNDLAAVVNEVGLRHRLGELVGLVARSDLAQELDPARAGVLPVQVDEPAELRVAHLEGGPELELVHDVGVGGAERLERQLAEDPLFDGVPIAVGSGTTI